MTEQLDRARVEAMYASQLEARQDELDIEWWKNPEGVEVLGDEMKFLFVTDAAEHAMLAVLGDSFLEYQREHVGDGEQVTIAVMVMMGGMLPGVYLHDYVEHVRGDLPKVEFGTIGTKFYDKPGVPLKEPEVVQDVSIDIEGEMVGLVDDMGDSGRTTEFLLGVLREKGVRGVVLVMPYFKPDAVRLLDGTRVISFGVSPQDTWIITPRERVETFIKRVPYWRDELGASMEDCRQALIKIGYSNDLINRYLPYAYALKAKKD